MQRLTPSIEHLSAEYVLVQAWKKASAHIRYHNSFSDTLALDLAAVDLPRFTSRLSKKIQSGRYEPDPLKLVLAPKNQCWHVNPNGVWKPRKKETTKIRPLAHVSLEDQVVATAVLLCLSERAENAQGDPRGDFRNDGIRKSMMSYGNRLFCDFDDNNKILIHRWGSAKLYRSFFEDYRSFLKRPEMVAASKQTQSNVLLLQTDLSQFYDRVQPNQLIDRIKCLKKKNDDKDFYSMVKTILNWSWNKKSLEHINKLGNQKIPNMGCVALPQGLVSAGFFANIFMLDFDNQILSQIGQYITPEILLLDACRYVDDIRLTISVTPDIKINEAQNVTMAWLDGVLAEHCPNQLFSKEKTTTTSLKNSLEPLVQQSRKMERIQKTISCGFDASGGEEVIQSLEALVRTQADLANTEVSNQITALRGVPDVKDDTVNRFAAGRFRKTFRSLRPLLDDDNIQGDQEFQDVFRRNRFSKQDLDNEAHTVAMSLVQKWINDPSNVRLLRIGLDIWPSPQILEPVLKLLYPYLKGDIKKFREQRIALYCLTEILKAGAVETGFVEDSECLPRSINISAYRELLLHTAELVLSKESRKPPWYVKQQALLYIAVHKPKVVIKNKMARSNRRYWRLVSFLNGSYIELSDSMFAKFAIVVRRSFSSNDGALGVASKAMTKNRHLEIAKRDIEFAKELRSYGEFDFKVHSSVLVDLGVDIGKSKPGLMTLSSLVLRGGQLNHLRNDIGVLTFAKQFMQLALVEKLPDLIPPSKVQVRIKNIGKYESVDKIFLTPGRMKAKYKSIYSVPSWVSEDQLWRFQLGYLLRFILTAHVDFGLSVRRPSWRESQALYRPARVHWLQRQYGFYNGHEAFGDDWLPISQSTQDLLYNLLVWPGCRVSQLDEFNISFGDTQTTINKAVNQAVRNIGPSTQTLMLKVNAPFFGEDNDSRPLRACVVQSMMPQKVDFHENDLEMSSLATRKKHRQHLSTALAAVEKMLDLRETHKFVDNRLDWLIFPELAIHPKDVQSHLVPFARSFKTIILTGICYEQLVYGEPLVNSALWVIPHKVPGQGLKILTVRQGKQNLSPAEEKFNTPDKKISGFRPVQWLVGYKWQDKEPSDPLWLTASICYDATDLNLASDLRSRSDVFAIPAWNKDVGTFDQMAQALHYHMYQFVLIANNGAFGGSNAYLPKGEAYQRQVFHTHGQPQSTISFFEIEDIGDMKERWKLGKRKKNKGWKYPPSG